MHAPNFGPSSSPTTHFSFIGHHPQPSRSKQSEQDIADEHSSSYSGS